MKRTFKSRRAPRGMTLIEIMVVLIILGLIAAAVASRSSPSSRRRESTGPVLDIENVEWALKLYYARKGKFPDTATGLKALVDMQILDKMPKDAWNNDYVYILESGRPIITCYGADGVPGGEGPNADITNRPDQKP